MIFFYFLQADFFSSNIYDNGSPRFWIFFLIKKLVRNGHVLYFFSVGNCYYLVENMIFFLLSYLISCDTKLQLNERFIWKIGKSTFISQINQFVWDLRWLVLLRSVKQVEERIRTRQFNIINLLSINQTDYS